MYIYNQQGNYAVEQSISDLLGISLLCGKLHTDDKPCLLRDIRFILGAIAVLLFLALITIITLAVFWSTAPNINVDQIDSALLLFV